jgi:ribosomal protein S18 acetylase RimI-like enzyme
MISYRRAMTDDAPLLVQMRMEFLAELHQKDDSSSTEADLRDNLLDYFYSKVKKNEFIAWLAVADDKVVATSGLTFYQIPPSTKNPTGKIAYIMNMYTQPAYRRRGIADELFSKLMEEAVSLGYRKISLHASNMGMNLYVRHGFKTPNTPELVKYI